MAIKVIFQGQRPEDKPYEGTCYTCKTKIECLQADGTIKPAYDQRDRESLIVICPTCKGTINCYPISETRGWGSYYDR